MKNLYLRGLSHSLRLYRQCCYPAKLLLAQVALVSSPFFSLRRRSLPAVEFGAWRKAYSFIALTCFVVVGSFMLLGGEGVSLAYRTSPQIVSAEIQKNKVVSEVETAPAEFEKTHISADSVDELILQLKQENLWNVTELERMPNVLVSNFPADLKTVDVPVKKRTFIASVLPAAMTVLDEIRQERSRLITIVGQLGGTPTDLVFSQSNSVWQDALGKDNVVFISRLAKKYRTENAQELLDRVNVLPLSLIIAQGAIESSWGSSRFASQANNLFGMWTWGKKGLIPERRDPGKTHKIALYDSIIDSIRAYVLTINRVSAYDSLRQIRRQTLDSYSLSEGLLPYSQRKELYVRDVKRIIGANNLTTYDEFAVKSS